MGIGKIFSKLKGLSNFKVGNVIATGVGRVEWILYAVRGNILEIATATIIRTAEGHAINAAKEKILRRKWKRARTLLQKCVHRTRWLGRQLGKLRRIVSIVRRIVKIASRVAKFIPGGGKAVSKVLDKVGKILDAVYGLINVVKLAIDYVNFVCQQLLNQLRDLREKIRITDEDEEQAAKEGDDNWDDEEPFSLGDDWIIPELDDIDLTLDELDALSELQLKGDCESVMSDASLILDWILLQFDGRESDFYQMGESELDIYEAPGGRTIYDLVEQHHGTGELDPENITGDLSDPEALGTISKRLRGKISTQIRDIKSLRNEIANMRSSLGLEDIQPDIVSYTPASEAESETIKDNVYLNTQQPSTKPLDYTDKDTLDADRTNRAAILREIKDTVRAAENAEKRLNNDEEL